MNLLVCTIHLSETSTRHADGPCTATDDKRREHDLGEIGNPMLSRQFGRLPSCHMPPGAPSRDCCRQPKLEIGVPSGSGKILENGAGGLNSAAGLPNTDGCQEIGLWWVTCAAELVAPVLLAPRQVQFYISSSCTLAPAPLQALHFFPSIDRHKLQKLHSSFAAIGQSSDHVSFEQICARRAQCFSTREAE